MFTVLDVVRLTFYGNVGYTWQSRWSRCLESGDHAKRFDPRQMLARQIITVLERVYTVQLLKKSKTCPVTKHWPWH